MALRKNSKTVFKWIIYSLLLLFLYSLQTAPFFLQIGNVKPFLLIPLAVCISLYEEETTSAVFGLVTGFLWDFSSGKVFGFFGIIIMICCIAITLLSMYLIRVNIVNALIAILAVCLVLNIYDFVFYYLIWGYEKVMYIFWNSLLSTIYTVILATPFYYLVRRITEKYSGTIRN